MPVPPSSRDSYGRRKMAMRPHLFCAIPPSLYINPRTKRLPPAPRSRIFILTREREKMAFKVLISFLFISMVLIQCASACPSCGEPYKPPTHKPPAYKPPVQPHYPANPHCPVSGFKLDACFDLLHGLLNVVIGHPPSGSECCPVIAGLVDFEAAACLCQVVKADILGIHLELEKKFSLLVNTCGCSIPKSYKCA